MAMYVFIYGKNAELSLAEIVSCLEARGCEFRLAEHAEYFALIETEALPQKIMELLGGTLKVGGVIFYGNAGHEEAAREMERRLDFGKMFAGLPDKALIAVSSYNTIEEQEFFRAFFRKHAKALGVRPGFVHLPRGSTALTHTGFIEKKLAARGKEFMVFGRTGVAETLSVHNPYDFRKRDLGRPAQRTSQSIPPRLCRIMINLSGTRGGLLLDPFCGMGAILQEAALMGFGVRGLDREENCVQGCIKNLAWTAGQYGIVMRDLGKKIRRGDARKLDVFFGADSVDAIVTEPYLGPVLNTRPPEREARRIIEETRPLYSGALAAMAKVLRPGGRIVMVTPCFMVGSCFVRHDMEAMCSGAGLRLVDPLEKYKIPHDFPLLDYGERHSTIREINVMEKPVIAGK